MKVSPASPPALDREKFQLALRLKRGSRSLREAAEELGMNFGQLARYERGESPSLENYMILCRWLGLDMNYFEKVEA
jgi:transcriptional regulator with XRE-family HTH domain